MHIDISRTPPADLALRRRRYYARGRGTLAVTLAAIILAGAALTLDTGLDELLLNIAFVLFVGSGLVFVYFVEKYQEVREIDLEREKKLDELADEWEVIATYRRLLRDEKRRPVQAEYEAMVSYADRERAASRRH